MPLLVNSVPNLAQGVSQQPDNLRFPGQCDEQINAWATVVEGLVKRPNSRHVGKLFTSKVSNDAFVQLIDRDETSQYAAVIDANDCSVFDLDDGSEKTVTITADAQTYLDGITTPRTDVKALTVADYTFIANKEQTVSLGSTTSAALAHDALVFVKLGDYSKEYSVEIEGQKFIYESGDGQNAGRDSTGNSAGTGRDADTEYIAGQIGQTLGTGGQVTSVAITNGGSGYTSPPDVTFANPATGTDEALGYALLSGGVVTEIVVTHGGRGYTSAPAITFGSGSATATATIATTGVSQTVEVQNACIKITGASDFSISVKDGLADQGIGLVYKEVSSITDLPAKAYNNFRVKVKGDTELAQDDYYVKFQTKNGLDFDEGTWVEDTGYGVKTEINATTMPLQLVPDATFTNWTLDVADWTDRLVGDDESNPAPTFVGSKVNDIFFFKNRLGILTDSSIVFSEADEYFNFWRTTVLSLLDSAPIDVGISHTKVALLKHAIPFQEKLLIFSEGTQFVLRGSDLLTPKTVSITPATEYDADAVVKPIVLNNYVYFPFKRNSHIGLTEYFVDNDTNIFDASEITAQVPTYIKSNVVAMAGTSVENVIALVNDQNRKEVFVYKFFWQNKEKIQSAWQKFTFGRDVISLGFIESNLYLVTNDATSTYLDVLPMENDLQDDNGYTLLLDNRVDGSSFSSVPTNPNPTATTEVGMKVIFLTDSTDFPINTYGEITAKDEDPFDTGFAFPTADGNPTYSSPYPQVRVINSWHPHITSGNDYDLVQVQIAGGVLNNMKFGNTSAGSQWIGLGGGRGVDWEVLYDTPVVYHTIRSDDTSVSDDFYENVPAESRGTKWEAIAGDIFYNTATKKTTIFQIPYDTTGIELYTKIGTEREVSVADSSTINVTGTLASYVSYSGSIYKCIETHTSTDSETPDTSAKWAVSTELSSATAWSSGSLYNDDTYFFIGKPYDMLYKFSDQTLKQPTERGGRSASDYTYQTIRSGSLNYAETGHFTVEVTPRHRDTYTYAFNPDILGADLTLNVFTPQDGHFRFPVQCQPEDATIEVKSSSALPCKLLAAEFESMMIPRSRRYGS